jgi:hypothetical protein
MSNKGDQAVEAAPVEQTQHAIYVAEGTGKTAQNEGATAKVVYNVSADGSYLTLYSPNHQSTRNRPCSSSHFRPSYSRLSKSRRSPDGARRPSSYTVSRFRMASIG